MTKDQLDALVEARAKAMCEAVGWDWQDIGPEIWGVSSVSQKELLIMARATLEADRAWCKEHQVKWLAREPTVTMKRRIASACRDPSTPSDPSLDIFRSAWDAAPGLERARELDEALCETCDGTGCVTDDALPPVDGECPDCDGAGVVLKARMG